MSRASAWFVHISVLLAGVTGLVYGWMRYFAQPADEFSNFSPWQPEMKALHILVVPLLVFGCGLLWRSHVWARIRAGFAQRRRSGILMAALLLPMVITGYLVQVAVDPTLHRVWMWVHGVSGTLWVAVYAWHQVSRRADR